MKKIIDICIATRKRNESLSQLLEKINVLNISRYIVDLSVIVVDNDIHGGAFRTITSLQTKLSYALFYKHEKKIGITFARNAALESVRENAEFVVFIDDDELPAENWLDELLFIQEKFNADIVNGPVISHYLTPPPKWVINGGFFNRRSHNTGDILPTANTGNVLVKKTCINDVNSKLGYCFDNRLAVRGGSDNLFFRICTSLGYKIVWADSAAVYETVSTGRINAVWILKRAFRLAQTDYYVSIYFKPSFVKKVSYILLGGARVVIGIMLSLITAIPSLFLGIHLVIKNLRVVARGFGFISGVFNIWYEEYQKVEES